MNKIKSVSNKKNIYKQFIPLVLILFWILYTLINPFMDLYNTDEVWAYDIAADLNLFEIIKMMHYEGHTFLWYFILKPFTYFPTLFPAIIKYLNWVFCFGTIGLLWKYAPFNNWIKAAITVSSPFLVIYPHLGRCYGLAIFLLFLLTIFYKKRLEHPIWYSLLIFFTTNTCINSAFMTFVVSIMFIYDLVKYNGGKWHDKKVLIPIIIVCSAFLSLVLQWIPIHTPKYLPYFGKFDWFKQFIFPSSSSILYKFFAFIVFVPLFQIVCYYNFISVKEKRWLYAGIFLINSILLFYFFFYSGRNYHFYFLYIYLILLYWLLIENCHGYKESKHAFYSLSTFVLAVSIIFNSWLLPTQFWFTPYSPKYDAIREIKAFVPYDSTMYIVLDLNQDIIPYLKNFYNLKTPYGDKVPSYKAYKNIYQKSFLNPENIKLKSGENAYYLIANRFMNMYGHNIRINNFYKDCVQIEKIYTLCKLPLKADKIKDNSINMYRQLNFIEELDKLPYESKEIIKFIYNEDLIAKYHIYIPKKRIRQIKLPKNISDFVPEKSKIYTFVELDIKNFSVLSKKYKLLNARGKVITPSDIKNSRVYNTRFKLPQQIRLGRHEQAYYLVSGTMLERYNAKNFMPKGCIDLYNEFYICKLPISRENMIFDKEWINDNEKSDIWKRFYLYDRKNQ